MNENEPLRENTNAHDKYTQAYVGILNTYDNQISTSITKKNELKGKFFTVIQGIMITLTALFCISIIACMTILGLMINKNYQSVSVIAGTVTTMLSTLLTMIISIFKLPEIIANYLFDKEEDKHMNEIIKNIQNYEIETLQQENLAIKNAASDSLESSDIPLTQSPNTNGNQPGDAENQLSQG